MNFARGHASRLGDGAWDVFGDGPADRLIFTRDEQGLKGIKTFLTPESAVEHRPAGRVAVCGNAPTSTSEPRDYESDLIWDAERTFLWLVEKLLPAVRKDADFSRCRSGLPSGPGEAADAYWLERMRLNARANEGEVGDADLMKSSGTPRCGQKN